MCPVLLLAVALQASPQVEVLDFTADWCGPCQQMASTVARLKREGYPIRQVNVDQQRDLAGRYQISGIPAFVLVVNGREVERLVGFQQEGKLRQLLAKIPAPAPTREVATAEPPKKSGFSWPFGKQREAPQPPAFPDAGAVTRGQSPPPAADASPTRQVAPTAARDPIETAVRIKVKDPKGADYGSGTVIASRNGKALVLTCWHIFRTFGGDASVEVDLFPQGPKGAPQTFSGKLVDCDEEADVALVSVEDPRLSLIAVSPLAATDQFPKKRDLVFSVGCGNGEPPSKIQHLVTRINPYQGPDATECTEMPVVGRSGGGLFDRDGRVIGVCFASAPATKTGVYVGPKEIHKLVSAAGLALLIPAAGTVAVAEVDAQVAPAELGEALGESPFGPTSEVVAAETALSVPAGQPRPEFEPNGGDYSDAIAALEAGAEVTCTIRPLASDARSEVVVIHKASPRFIKYLRGELDGRPAETSMRVSAGTAAASAAPLSRRCYVVLAAAHAPTAGVALLSRVFDNHGRF